MDEQHIIIFGNPVDGYEFVGPFDSADDAIEYGQNSHEKDWYIAPLTQP